MIAAPLVMFLLVLELVRRRRLREDYSLLWLGTFGMLFVLSLFHKSLLQIVSDMMGIAYPPTAFLVIFFGMLLLVMIQFSVVISRLAKENQKAAQHIALLARRVSELEKKLEGQEES